MIPGYCKLSAHALRLFQSVNCILTQRENTFETLS